MFKLVNADIRSSRLVMPWDPMPHEVCHSCMVKLNHFDEFYEACLRAERFFRTLYPSAPDHQLESFNPVVEVLQQPLLDKTFRFSSQSRNTTSTSLKIPNPPPNSDQKKDLSCFIINELTQRDCIFTCRECFRTFTKESSALTHTCVRLEDCEELKVVGMDNDQKKSLPPLKIRLYSMRCGLFVCYLCQAQFEDKENLSLHLKEHFEEEKRRDEEDIMMQGAKRQRSHENDLLMNGGKRTKKKKRKKWIGSEESSVNSTTVEDCSSFSSLMKEAESSPENQNSSNELEIFQEIETSCATFQKSKQRTKEEAKCGDIGAAAGATEDITSKTVQEECEVEKPEEVTVIEVVDKRSPTSFSSCVFCDKIFATNGALIAHQRKHLQGCLGVNFENIKQNDVLSPREAELKLTAQSSYYSFLCSTCAMMFTNKKTLLEHEQYHLVDFEAIG